MKAASAVVPRASAEMTRYVRESRAARFNEAEHETEEASRHERRADPVDAGGLLLVPALGHSSHDGDHQGRERDVDVENPSPRELLDQPAADYRPDAGSNRGEPSPGPDCASAALLTVARGDQGKTARHEQRRADALRAARHDQKQHARCDAACGRGTGKDHCAEHEREPASPAIAKRAAHEQQRCQEQHVRLDDPLRFGYRCPELLTEDWQRDVDDRAIDEHHARPEDGGDQGRAAP